MVLRPLSQHRSRSFAQLASRLSRSSSVTVLERAGLRQPGHVTSSCSGCAEEAALLLAGNCRETPKLKKGQWTPPGLR
ncbi:hypothetical protein NDU88_003040 [Pleurodeles waltl]|uniref:Uncharacterized protein n=1 Tax=Pleurodeles waltl TaxID=8319 RepID=A0AAV7WRW9_PLEWA|nr:hypothetical protein NDU88_003040 [Pleurodeles waltl]